MISQIFDRLLVLQDLTCLDDYQFLSIFILTITLICQFIANTSQLVLQGAQFHWTWSRQREIDQEKAITNRLLDQFPNDTLRRASQNYIQPDLADYDPNHHNPQANPTKRKNKAFNELDMFIASDSKFLIILADTGAGKTSLLINYFIRERGKSKGHTIAILWLAHNDTDFKISSIKDPQRTILVLDAFDEDPKAITDHQARITDLISKCSEFMKVIITCRSQFFSNDGEIPDRTGQLSQIKLNITEHVFQKKYIQPFSNYHINIFLFKRLLVPHKIWAAKKLLSKTHDLNSRPFLLAFIPDLIKDRKTYKNISQLYKKIIDEWIAREAYWIPNSESLQKFSEQLAVDIYINRMNRKMEAISQELLEPLATKWGIELKAWQLKSRSLLVRDAVGNYRFAHRSIMEYLCFVSAQQNPECPLFGIPWTDQMHAFCLENIDLNSDNLSNHNLNGSMLYRASLIRKNITNSCLKGVNMIEADARDSILEGSDISEAYLSKANLSGAKLGSHYHSKSGNSVEFNGITLRKNPTTTKYSTWPANLRGSILENADLSNSIALGVCLSSSKMKGTKLHKALLMGADFSAADLREANMTESNLREAIFNNADLTGANLRGATLIGAEMRNSNLTGADFRGAKMRNVDLTGAIIKGLNISGAKGLNREKKAALISRGAVANQQAIPGVITTT